MIELTEIIRVATAKIDRKYFHLSIDGGDDVFRERVYCYELYHQMRKNWPTGSQLVLNGEIDKQGHPFFKKLAKGYAKPDFLIHLPGSMAEKHNHAIIEVKHSIDDEGVRKDLRTLNLFIRKVRYTRAIYLIYGPNADENGFIKIKSIADEKFEDIGPIEVWLHKEVGQPAAHHSTIQKAKNKFV